MSWHCFKIGSTSLRGSRVMESYWHKSRLWDVIVTKLSPKLEHVCGHGIRLQQISLRWYRLYRTNGYLSMVFKQRNSASILVTWYNWRFHLESSYLLVEVIIVDYYSPYTYNQGCMYVILLVFAGGWNRVAVAAEIQHPFTSCSPAFLQGNNHIRLDSHLIRRRMQHGCCPGKNRSHHSHWVMWSFSSSKACCIFH